MFVCVCPSIVTFNSITVLRSLIRMFLESLCRLLSLLSMLVLSYFVRKIDQSVNQLHKAFIEILHRLFVFNFMEIQLSFIAIYMEIEINLAIKADKRLLNWFLLESATSMTIIWTLWYKTNSMAFILFTWSATVFAFVNALII